MQKASRHPANSKAWIDGSVDEWIDGMKATVARFIHPLIHQSNHPGFRIGGAPTHCMHGVAGTISLP